MLSRHDKRTRSLCAWLAAGVHEDAGETRRRLRRAAAASARLGLRGVQHGQDQAGDGRPGQYNRVKIKLETDVQVSTTGSRSSWRRTSRSVQRGPGQYHRVQGQYNRVQGQYSRSRSVQQVQVSTMGSRVSTAGSRVSTTGSRVSTAGSRPVQQGPGQYNRVQASTTGSRSVQRGPGQYNRVQVSATGSRPAPQGPESVQQGPGSVQQGPESVPQGPGSVPQTQQASGPGQSFDNKMARKITARPNTTSVSKAKFARVFLCHDSSPSINDTGLTGCRPSPRRSWSSSCSRCAPPTS